MDVKITFNDFTVTGANQLNNVTIKLLKGEKGDPGEPTDAQVTSAVNTWLAAHPEATTTVQDGAISYAKLDSNLKATADDVSDLKSSLKGFNPQTKAALLALFQKCAFVDDDAQTYYDALEDALYPPADLDHITATYSGSAVLAGTDIETLRSNLTVLAVLDNGTSQDVTTYALSGSLTSNPSAITVTYGGKSTTVSIPVITLDSITAVYTQSGNVYDTDTLDSLKSDLVVTAHYSDSTTVTVTGYTLSGTLAEGTSTITVNYGGKTTTFNVTVSVVYYKFDGSGNHVWADPDAIIGVTSPSELLFVAGTAITGGTGNWNHAMPSAVKGRAASRTQIWVGMSDGQTIGLSSYTLSTGVAVVYAIWYGYIDESDNSYDGTQYISSVGTFTANEWLSESKTLPTSSASGKRLLLIAFKRGDGSEDFTSAELEELPNLIQIS